MADGGWVCRPSFKVSGLGSLLVRRPGQASRPSLEESDAPSSWIHQISRAQASSRPGGERSSTRPSPLALLFHPPLSLSPLSPTLFSPFHPFHPPYPAPFHPPLPCEPTLSLSPPPHPHTTIQLGTPRRSGPWRFIRLGGVGIPSCNDRTPSVSHSSKPLTLYPKPFTLNPKPLTLNPKPCRTRTAAMSHSPGHRTLPSHPPLSTISLSLSLSLSLCYALSVIGPSHPRYLGHGVEGGGAEAGALGAGGSHAVRLAQVAHL